MKKILAILLSLMLVAALAACEETPAPGVDDTTPPPVEETTPVEDVSPEVETPVDEETPADEVTPDEELPADEEPSEEETPVDAPDEGAPVVADTIELTVTGVQENWYLFDLSAFGTPGFVYALYFDDGATVTFAAATQLTAFDAAFTMTTKDIAAGESVAVEDINGFSAALGATGNSVCFVLASNPGNYTGLVPDQPMSSLPENVVITVA
ncbi:MAG: hypothetical protein LBH17_00915 [Oscillospiraceae bacterium]|jgi:hypothetical protein|nr:hypothetical protein [Oscillospiraceae bacterium]